MLCYTIIQLEQIEYFLWGSQHCKKVHEKERRQQKHLFWFSGCISYSGLMIHYCRFKTFSGRTLKNWVWTSSRGFLLHMYNAVGGCPLRCVHKGHTSCSRQRQDIMYTFKCVCVQHIDTGVSSYHHKPCWHLHLSLLLVWLCFFILRYTVYILFVFVFFSLPLFSFLRVRSIINPPNSLLVNPGSRIICCVLTSDPLDFLLTLYSARQKRQEKLQSHFLKLIVLLKALFWRPFTRDNFFWKMYINYGMTKNYQDISFVV